MQAAHSAAVADGVLRVGEDGEETLTSSTTSAIGDRLDAAESRTAPAEESTAAGKNAPLPPASGEKSTQAAAKAPPKSSTASPPPAAGAGKKKGPPLRRGKWTPEEEAYASRLIQEFKAGLLPLTDGTTLRTFLSKLLNCDPMRISKKFVGNNCIGKQVFRRRTAEINRLTTEEIQASQQELSELERRFLDRVAQTNRVKTSSNNAAPQTSSSTSASANPVSSARAKDVEMNNSEGFSNRMSSTGAQDSVHIPPWLAPPTNFNFSSSRGTNRAAAIGRALLQDSAIGKGSGTGLSNSPRNSLSQGESAGLRALAEMQRCQNMQVSLLQNQQALQLQHMAALQKSAAAGSGQAAAALANNNGLSNSVMAQIARNASAARLAGIAASQNSMNNMMLKTGLSRDQLSQLARDGNLSTHSIDGMAERQSSFDALMSLDFQSLQSIDNLANLIQTGGSGNLQDHIPRTGIKNWNPMDTSSYAAAAGSASLAGARRVASQGRMDSLIRSLSSGQGLSSGTNAPRNLSNAGFNLDPNTSFSNLLHNLSGNMSGIGNGESSAENIQNILGGSNPFSTMSLANMLRADSSTGLSSLRMKDGLMQRNSSVDDFLSLVASGDIPHQDPHMLNMPLQSVMQQQGAGMHQSSAQAAAASILAQQQFLAHAAASNSGNSSHSLSEAIRANPFSFLNQWAQSSAGSNGTMSSALSQQQAQINSALAQAQQPNEKRKYSAVESETNTVPAKR